MRDPKDQLQRQRVQLKKVDVGVVVQDAINAQNAEPEYATGIVTDANNARYVQHGENF